MRDRARMPALVLAAALGLTSCAAPEPAQPTAAPQPSPTPTVKTEERLDFVLPCYPAGGFHPITGSNKLNLTLAPLLYQGLFSVDREFQAHHELCRTYTVSEDGLVWTFQLAQAEFSDGAALTAREVVRSLETARNSDRFSGRLKDVKSVGGEGETVVVTLSRENGALPVLLDIPIVKEGEDPQRPLGTGRYILEGEENSLRLTAREGAKVPLKTIPLRAVGAGDDLVYAFDAREISLVDVDLTGTNALGYSGRLETVDYPTTELLYVGFNCGEGACREPAVRRALSRLVDRETITDRLLAGHGSAAELPVHPALGYTLPELSYDRETAEELLREDGWSRDEEGRLWKGRNGLSLRLIVNQENTYKVTVAEALVEELEAVGCAVTLAKLPWDGFAAALEAGEFDLYLGETMLTADFDLEALLGPEGTLNYGGFQDEELQSRMDALRAARGTSDRNRAARTFYERVGEVAPLAAVCFKNGSLLTQWGQVRGAEPTQRDVFAGMENWSVLTTQS